MKKLNQKGFTLIEVLAVIVLLAVVSGIAIPNVMNSVKKSKEKSEQLLIENILSASEQLFEEVEYNKATIYKYDVTKDANGDYIIIKQTGTNAIVNIENNKIKITLQTLVTNGFLTKNSTKNKPLKNPRTGELIGNCEIKITKNVDANYKVTYTVENVSGEKCPNY